MIIDALVTGYPVAGIPSPNHGPRREGQTPDILLLHYTGMPDPQAALARLCAQESEVSAHYLVFEDGHVAQMVAEDRRAWHAGAGTWQGIDDINSRSIGIEIANPGHDHGYRDFPPVQIAAVIALASDILRRHSIPAARVLAHSDVAPARKQDPGERFPWETLHAAGIGHWVDPAPLDLAGSSLTPGMAGGAVLALQKALAAYGYAVETNGHYDARTATVVMAFQRHFRAVRVDGIADPSTVATLERLLTAL